MIADLFLAMTEYPFFRRIVWKPIYEQLALRFDNNDWHFMNYGYCPSAAEKPILLDEEDEIHRFPLQLYYYLASRVPVKDKTVLEVGSGRGGGAAGIHKYLQPLSITGIDIARNAVNFASGSMVKKESSFSREMQKIFPTKRPPSILLSM